MIEVFVVIELVSIASLNVMLIFLKVGKYEELSEGEIEETVGAVV